VPREVVAWDLDRIEAVAAARPAKLQAMPYLGANCGHGLSGLCAAALEDLDFLHNSISSIRCAATSTR
jgi:hypothetical protein